MASSSKFLRVIQAAIALLLITLIAGVVLLSPKQEKEIIDFSLTSGSKTWSLNQYRGKVVVLFFGYTSCPDVCPTSMLTLSQLLAKLNPEEVDKIQPVFVSVDPARDTPEVLKSYARHFDKRIIAVTGTKAELDKVTSELGVFYRINRADSNGEYSVDHSTVLFVIGTEGEKKETLISHVVPVEYLLESVRAIFAN